MNTQSIEGQKVESGNIAKPGDFCFDEEQETIYVWLPGMSGPAALSIQRGQPGGDRVWGWDGNTEKPTLTPSIHVPNQWHGYLRAGRLESC